MQLHTLASIHQCPAQEWNTIVGSDYPFGRHEFLAALEDSGSVGGDSGWLPCHATLQYQGKTVAVMPMYRKLHSYGEYVFDWSWADAWQRHGLAYYPKLLAAIPFTPATGPRLSALPDWLPQAEQAMGPALSQFCADNGLSSWHVLFPAAPEHQAWHSSALRRTGVQYHWQNNQYRDFDHFLAGFSSRYRKKVKRERRRVAEQGIQLQTLSGADLTAAHLAQFYRFYQDTYLRRSGHSGYLRREFFLQLVSSMPEQLVLIVANRAGQAIAGALCFRSADTLYGRYWGASEDVDALHFEACYYQGIDYCIAHQLQHFDPGAQGEHKIQRGFNPTPVYSFHHLQHAGLGAAVADFLRREEQHINQYINHASDYLPFKQSL